MAGAGAINGRSPIWENFNNVQKLRVVLQQLKKNQVELSDETRRTINEILSNPNNKYGTLEKICSKLDSISQSDKIVLNTEMTKEKVLLTDAFEPSDSTEDYNVNPDDERLARENRDTNIAGSLKPKVFTFAGKELEAGSTITVELTTLNEHNEPIIFKAMVRSVEKEEDGRPVLIVVIKGLKPPTRELHEDIIKDIFIYPH